MNSAATAPRRPGGADDRDASRRSLRLPPLDAKARAPRVGGLARAILFGLSIASLAGFAPDALAHGGQVVPPPPPEPRPPWERRDPYTPMPPPPLTPPKTPPLPIPGRTPGFTPPPTTPDGRPVQPGFTPRPPSATPPGGTPPGAPPPTTPPPTTPPPTTGPSPTPTPGTPPETGAPAPPSGRPVIPTRRDRSLPGRRSVPEGLDWATWWDLHGDRIRGRAAAAPVLTGFDAGEHLRSHARRVEVLPFLRAAARGQHGLDDDVLASAYIALGKATDDPADADLLLEALRNARHPMLRREGAAVGLACLRRSDEASRFDGRLLDRVRRILLETYDDDTVPVRVRAYAAFAVGVLGDQPGDPGDGFSTDLRATTQALWARLNEPRTGTEGAVALLAALALQPPAGVPDGVREGLRALAATGRLGRRDRGDVVQAHAVLCYAKLEGSSAAGWMLGLVKANHQPVHVRRSAMVALGHVAPTLETAARAGAMATLLVPARRGDPETMGVALLSLGRLVGAGLLEGADPSVLRAADALLDAADHGAHDVRPYAALALGLALRDLDQDTRSSDDGRGVCVERARLRVRVLRRLAEEVDASRGDPELRAAFALALGLATDLGSTPRLGRLVASDGEAPALRAAAAGALGLLRRSASDVYLVLRLGLGPKAPEPLRREAARALGVLGDAGAVGALLDEIRGDRPDHVRGRAAAALGGIRAVAAVRPLIEVARDRRVSDPVRAVAIAALGVVGDPEPVPSLVRLKTDVNYIASTDALNEVLSLL